MSPKSKKEYLESILSRYRRASKKIKQAILDEFCFNCHYHRKHAIRLLRTYKRYQKPVHKKRGRKPKYNRAAVLAPLKRIWLTANLPWSRRLKAILALWLPAYERSYGRLTDSVRAALGSISAATIDRLLVSVRCEYKTKGRSTTKPGTLLKQHILIKTNQWDETRPGFLEADTIAHCGTSLSGEFAYTVDGVDIATGWTEQRAVFGKGEIGVLEQLRDMEQSLPFPLLGFDSDNGSEFLNHHLYRHFTERKKPVQFTRSRPYKKDDNAHVEQKNWTHVRQWFGYERFSDRRIVPLMNELYRSEWRLFHNFFCPSVKLKEKKRVGSKMIKVHDAPKTPYQRVLESSHIDTKIKHRLKEQSESLNPFMLRKAIEKKLAKIFTLV